MIIAGADKHEVLGEVCKCARRVGREDDVRVLDCMAESGLKDSHTFNPFATGNAGAIVDLLAGLAGGQVLNDRDGIFRERAVALVGTIAPALVWLRDQKGIPLSIDVIRFSMALRWISKSAMQKKVLLRDPETGLEREIDVQNEVPKEIIWALRSYLGELPGFDPSVPLEKQRGDEPFRQHGYAQFYFTPAFTELGVTFAHIFEVECGGIDMRDVVLNRRILVVILPTLESSNAALASLGKLVVSSLRGVVAELLGASLDSDYGDAGKPGKGPSPFAVVVDEAVSMATNGMDCLRARGRALNISFRSARFPMPDPDALAWRQRGDPLSDRQWIERHCLDGQGKFNRALANAALVCQLGSPWTGPEAASRAARLLFLAFALHLSVRREEALALLREAGAEVAHSTTEERYTHDGSSAGLGTVSRQVDRWLADPVAFAEARIIAEGHAYTATALMELLAMARACSGVLPPAEFAWLKRIDRGLWYALHSLGYGTVGLSRYVHPNPLIEAAGAREHWAAECAAVVPVVEPRVDLALKRVLRSVPDRRFKEVSAPGRRFEEVWV